MLSKGYKRGDVDKTFFTLHDGEHILLVQVYIDDIIFGSTNLSLVVGFEKIMTNEFEMSMIEELSFFLRLQVI